MGDKIRPARTRGRLYVSAYVLHWLARNSRAALCVSSGEGADSDDAWLDFGRADLCRQFAPPARDQTGTVWPQGAGAGRRSFRVTNKLPAILGKSQNGHKTYVALV